VSITDYSYNSGSKRASVRAFVQLNGVATGVATVNATFGQGGEAITVPMTALGGGYYLVCNAGPLSSGSAPNVSLTATFNGVSDSASASGTSGGAIAGC
jgi:hypothetical protein